MSIKHKHVLTFEIGATFWKGNLAQAASDFYQKLKNVYMQSYVVNFHLS